MLRIVLATGMMALPVAAVAKTAEEVVAALPVAEAKRLRADPERFVAGALRLVYGHGVDGAVTKEAAEAAGRIDLAERRARALLPFLQSDLDNDGAVGRDEVAVRAAALSASARARLLAGFAQADGDGDGAVSAAELRGMAEAAATARRGGMAGAGYFAFDLDGDGRLTVAEVEAVGAALAGP